MGALEALYNANPIVFLNIIYYFTLKFTMFIVAGYHLFSRKGEFWKFLVLIALIHLLPGR